jgi:hypothetical protein
MFLRVKRGDFSGLFGSWAYGERAQLVPGSGLFIGQDGVSVNHHFLPQDDPQKPFETFGYLPASHTVEIYADVLGRKAAVKLGEVSVYLSEEACSQMYQDAVGVLFDWHPDQGKYIPEIEPKHDPQALKPPQPIRPGM